MPFDDDIQDDTDAPFIREAFTLRIRSAATGETFQVLEFPELVIERPFQQAAKEQE